MRLRRALLVTTAFSTVLLGSAGMAYAQAFDWSGFYVGVGVGGAGGFDGGELEWFDPSSEIWDLLGSGASGDTPILGGGTLTDFPGQVSGFGITGSVGFNTQMDNFLFGIEASVMSGPFEAESTYVESGSVSYTTSSLSTAFTTTLNPTTYYGTDSIYTSTLFTFTTTVTNGVTTSSWVTSDSTMTTLFSTISNTTTVVYPTVTTVESTFVSTETSSTSETTFTTVNVLSTTLVSYSTNGEWTETITGRASIDWLATIKGRIGVTADRTLFFATGGLAIAGISQETTAVLTVDGVSGGTSSVWHGSNEETRFGFVIGGGIEQALDDHWIISGEAEYFNLGTAEYDVLPVSGGATGTSITGHQTQVLDGGSVKFGIKYKF